MLEIAPARLVDLLDAIYRADGDEASWVERLLDAALGTIVGAAGATVTTAHTSWRRSSLKIEAMEVIGYQGMPHSWRPFSAAMQRQYSELIPDMVERAFGRTFGALFSENFGVPFEQVRTLPGWEAMWPAGVTDSLGLIAREPTGDGLCLNVGTVSLSGLRVRDRRLLQRLASHLAAGYRLRRKYRPLQAAEAVYTARGKLLHASGAAVDRLQALDSGRQRRESARSDRHDVEYPLEVWQGLVDGRWSLVEHLDTDGKRFLLALKNTPVVARRDELTARERHTAALAAMGHRDKEIAYMLGIAPGAVTSALHRVRRKWGVASRAELAKLWRSRESGDAS